MIRKTIKGIALAVVLCTTQVIALPGMETEMIKSYGAMSSTPEAKIGRVDSIGIEDSGSGGKKVVSKYDVNGDGKNDRVKLVAKSDYCGISVNGGKMVKAVNGGGTGGRMSAYMFRLKNGKRFIMMSAFFDDGCGTEINLYRVKGNDLVDKVRVEKIIEDAGGDYCEAKVKSVKKNQVTLSIDAEMFSDLGISNMNMVYKYSGGKLKLKSKSAKLTKVNMEKNATLTTAKRVKLFKSKKCSGKSSVLSKGTKCKVKKIYLSGKKTSYYVVTTSGKKGWLKWDYGASYDDPLFENVTLAD